MAGDAPQLCNGCPINKYMPYTTFGLIYPANSVTLPPADRKETCK